MAPESGPAETLARHWRPEGNAVRCLLCPHECLIAPGRRGRCLGRVNRDNRLIAASYGQLVSVAVDPVEKKPLYHFHPGENILSVATYGCNLNCPFCQNEELARHELPGRFTPPVALVELARRSGAFGVAFTYSEPLVWFEYLMDSCPALRAAGFKTVLVTNGMINPGPLEELLPHVDAMNIDLKSARPEFYRDYVGGSLSAVQHTIRTARKRCHVELTNLVIPGRNDSDADIGALVEFVAGLGRDTVLHLSRYFPHNRTEEPATPRSTLVRAAAIARRKLDSVHLGNV
ncbi:MAG TPA: AmmeMemoRadiSam system radical SAM enzyme [candidate division WOR-3 bacterium]|uniref:AmmeMemoRadiSam system radical SAM enzyme n=1 Tax=candidate division WOR-3 bacterium TaxID=2052148 RepID=A0A7V0T5C1_UNCW3|nr:AmmeMemoRadiSam system radical SAM enzyme [candidate division WOR-3 bacterium]